MAFDPSEFPRVLTIYLELSNYPIMAGRIRERMRKELFKRRIISAETFEEEVRQKAIHSQQREGLIDPFGEESPNTWNERISIIQDHLTDFYFAYNLPHDLFAKLVREVLAKRLDPHEVVLSFHPELAPWDMLFAQGEAYEALPDDERFKVRHHLQEIKVVLIKSMISDHLEYVGIAKKWFTIADITEIRSRRVGRGRIGGKAAGLMLAECILRKVESPDLLSHLRIPRSWFLGADVFYRFTQHNDLIEFSNQKYKSETEIRDEYPTVRDRYFAGTFPHDTVEGLRAIVQQVGKTPLIVRSSSLLEDSFGTSFAGKYQSHFCPNQDTPEENLNNLLAAIKKVYASVYCSEVMTYRRQMGLLDYDERMGILIQEVQGRQHGQWFYPDASGVAFSRNQYRWNPCIDRKAGFIRLVWGLGTRAVEQYEDDYPRLVALSHPALFPNSDPKHIRRYSQRYIDLIDLDANVFCSQPISKLLCSTTPLLRYFSQRYSEGHLQSFFGIPLELDPSELVITFDGALRDTNFPQLMRQMLETLEDAYHCPVDTEFVLMLDEAEDGPPTPIIHLVQCRPQSRMHGKAVAIPKNIPPERRLFLSQRLIPDGRVSDIRFAVYVGEKEYRALTNSSQRHEFSRLIGRINDRLADETFILLAPGRWGSVNPELGIPVTYADIYNSRALIEIVASESAPEPSYGTHFFQDLVEANIYMLVLALHDPGAEFNQDFFNKSPSALAKLMPEDSAWESHIRIIDIPSVARGDMGELVMDGDTGTALAYLKTNSNDL